MTYQQKLLIIDADDEVLRLLDESLSSDGYEVRTTSDVPRAMLLMRYYEPDAVLLAQEGEPSGNKNLPVLPTDENFSFVSLCRLWRIPIIYMLESPDSPYKRIWHDGFFR